MATTVPLDRSSAARPLAARLGVARPAYLLSLALALAAASAAGCLGTLLIPGLLRGPAVSQGSARGTALTLVVLTLPTLLASLWFAARGSRIAVFAWIGAVGSIAYQAVLFLFATPFNGMFLAYVAMLSLSVWSLVALLPRLDVAALAEGFSSRVPVRATAGYLVVCAVLFGLLWLKAVVPDSLSTANPAFLEGTGMTTGPVQILDLAFTLPLMFAASSWLWRRLGWGYVVATALLVMLAIETTSIGVDQWLGHAADPASPAASDALTPVFLVMSVIGLLPIAGLLRGYGSGR